MTTAAGGFALVLPMAPSANKYWRNVAGRTLLSTEARDYKARAAWSARMQGCPRFAGYVAVTLRVYRERRSGDLDNRIKVTLDSLRGIAYADDDQVVEVHAYRRDDPANPRIEVVIESVADPSPPSARRSTRGTRSTAETRRSP